MQRIQQINYQGMLVTHDTAAALRSLEKKASDNGKWKVKYLPVRSKAVIDPLSLEGTGRAIHFVFEKRGISPQDCLNAAWGCAVPLGFTPWSRYPLAVGQSNLYHYYGPWQSVHGKMLAEGRGHLAWPSVCCAAQVDLGVWSGDKSESRFVQAQLHRLGRNPGPLDGVVGGRTAAAIESLGLDRASLAQVAEYVRVATVVEKTDVKTTKGHMLLPGQELVVAGFGGVRAWQVPNGAGFEISGPGRIVVDVH